MGRFTKVNMDKSLNRVLRELQEDMKKTMNAPVSFAQSQRELALRVRDNGLHNFKKKGKRDAFFR